MGLFDDITAGGRAGQVKLYDCQLSHYKEGDKVPAIGHKEYSIAMREGGFVNVAHDTILSWTDEAQYDLVFDKWGAVYDERTTGGLLGPDADTYHFEREEA